MVHHTTSDAVVSSVNAEHDQLGALRKPLAESDAHQAFSLVASTSSSLSTSAVV